MIQVQLDPFGQAMISLTGYLGPRFAQFREACAAAGARYSPLERKNWLPVGQLPLLLEAFRKYDLPVQIAPEIAQQLAQEAVQMRTLLEEGRARVQACQAFLQAKKSKLALFRYQEVGIEWLAPRKNAVLADEMGLGKTVQAVVALPAEAAAIIVVPASLTSTWARELKQWRDDLTPVILPSSDSFRWPTKGEAIILTYGSLPSDEEIAAASLPEIGTVLIADEAHYLKNKKTKRVKGVMSLLQITRAYEGRAWFLTGTPLLNRPPELWNLFDIAGLAREAFSHWGNFCRLFNRHRTRGGFDWGEPTSEVVDRVRSVMLRRNREEVLKDLPRKVRSNVEVPLTDPKALALCDEILQLLKEKGIDLSNAKAELDESRINGAAFEKLAAARAALALAKIPATLEIATRAEEEGTPLLVFSAHQAPVLAFKKREGWRVITGSTSAKERAEIVDQFQAGELKGLAGTIGAMGVGLTLTHAAHVLMVDLLWTPALNSQAEDRVCRIGQKAAGIFITRLVCDHAVDERVLELLTIKQEIIEASVEASGIGATPHTPSESLVKAAERAAETAAALARNVEKAKATVEADTQAQRRVVMEARKKELGSLCDGRDFQVRGKLRSAVNAQEDHAASGLIQLAGMDPDHASKVNGVGFSKMDNDFGHSLAQQLQATEKMLTDKQWVAAVRLAKRYRRQIGEVPAV